MSNPHFKGGMCKQISLVLLIFTVYFFELLTNIQWRLIQILDFVNFALLKAISLMLFSDKKYNDISA